MPEKYLDSFSSNEISELLRHEGLYFQVGPFKLCAHSKLQEIVRHLIDMYGHYRVAISGFADIHFFIDKPNGLRSLLNKQVSFRFDDEFPFKPLPYGQARPFFEWGLNWCIATTAHQYLMIHAAVVAKDNRCTLIPGRPGAGKSTLCAALIASGWRLLSDEMALIHFEDGQIWPIPRPISLKNESIDIIRRRGNDIHIGPSFADTHKGTVAHMRAPQESVEAMHVPARAAWIVFPRYSAEAALSAIAVSPCQATLKLADDSFNFPLLGKEGFELLSDVTFGCDAYELHYNDLDKAIAWFDGLAARG